MSIRTTIYDQHTSVDEEQCPSQGCLGLWGFPALLITKHINKQINYYQSPEATIWYGKNYMQQKKFEKITRDATFFYIIVFFYTIKKLHPYYFSGRIPILSLLICYSSRLHCSMKIESLQSSPQIWCNNARCEE